MDFKSRTPGAKGITRGGSRIFLQGRVQLHKVSYTSFLKQSTSEPIRRKLDEVIFKEDEAWERS
jgi:hypothetical protein